MKRLTVHVTTCYKHSSLEGIQKVVSIANIVMCLLVKYRVALIYLKTGKYIKTLEEINSGLSKTKENSLNDIYVQFKLLQIQVYLNLQFYDQCLTKLRSTLSLINRTV